MESMANIFTILHHQLYYLGEYKSFEASPAPGDKLITNFSIAVAEEWQRKSYSSYGNSYVNVRTMQSMQTTGGW